MLLLSIFLHEKVKMAQNRIRKPSFGTPWEVQTCLLTLTLPKTKFGVLTGYFSFSHFVVPSCSFQKKKTKVIKFCIKIQLKKPIILPSQCTSLVLGSNLVMQNLMHFLKIFKRRCMLSGLMKLNLLLEMVLLSIFLNQKVKANENMTKKLSFGTPRKVFTCLLTLSLRTTPLGVFPHFFSFSHFLSTSCCFYKRKNTNSIKFCINLIQYIKF